MKLLSGIMLSVLLAGCGGEKELRSVSAQSAKMLTSYEKSLRDFAAGQSALNAETEARIQRFEGMRLEREAELSARVDTWKYIDDKASLHRLSVIAANDADDLIAAATPRLPPPGLPALKFDTGHVGEVVKQLVELQKPLTLEQRISHLVAYGAAVRKDFNEDIAAADEDTGIADTIADNAEESVIETTEKPPTK